MKSAFHARKGRAGAPRLARHLARGRRQVAQSLRRQGLRAKAARKYKATTNANHTLPVAENLLQQDFTAQRPNQVWVGDITYIWTDEGCSQEHRTLLEQHGLIASMSAKGNCYDNAAMESWNHSLKVEAIHGERFATREQARAHVFEYIELDYNRNRLHSTLGYLSPEQFELAMLLRRVSEKQGQDHGAL